MSKGATGRREDKLLFHSLDCCIGKRWKHPHSFAAGWMDGSVTASLLTLVELVQAAWAAERTESPRLQAAPALHPALCRPGLIPGSMKRSAATSHYIIMAKGWQGSKFLCSAIQRAQTCARWRADSTEQCRFPLLCPHVHKARHIYRGGGGHWSTAETALSNHPVRPAPKPCPPPLLCVTDCSRKVKWQCWD